MTIVPAAVRESEIAVRVTFSEPLFDAWRDNTQLAKEAHARFRDHGATLEDIRFNQGEALADVRLVVELDDAILVGIGLQSIGVGREEGGWADVPKLAKLTRAATGTLGVEPERDDARLIVERVLHVEPQGRTLAEVTSGLLEPAFLQGDSAPEACGLALHRSDSLLGVDLSAVYPGSLFLRANAAGALREGVEAIGAKARTGELRLLDVLGLELDDADDRGAGP